MSSTAGRILDAPDMMNIYIFRQVSSTAERILDPPDMMNIYIYLDRCLVVQLRESLMLLI